MSGCLVDIVFRRIARTLLLGGIAASGYLPFAASAAEPAPEPASKPVLISGTFLLIRDGYYQDPEWVRKHFLMMKDIGLDTVIIMWIGHQSPPDKAESPIHTFYHSKLYPPFPGITATNDPMENIFRVADELGMKVISAVEPLNGPGSKQDVVRDKKVSSEIFERFGKHPSFQGWYFSNEYSDAFWKDVNFRNTIGAYYREMVDHLHQISRKPVAIAPYFHKSSPEGNAGIWAEAFRTAGFDIIMMQDGVGCLPLRVPLAEIRPYYAALAKMCAENKVELWSDLESFAMDQKDPYLLHPAPLSRVRGQIDAVHDFVRKIVIYQFTITMNPPEASRNDTAAARELYEGYRRYYLEKMNVSPDLTVAASDIRIQRSQDGKQLEITAAIHNRGNHQVGQNIEVGVFDPANYDARRPLSKQIIPYLMAGERKTVTFSVAAGRLAGEQVLLTVDPMNKIYERDKANNQIRKSL